MNKSNEFVNINLQEPEPIIKKEEIYEEELPSIILLDAIHVKDERCDEIYNQFEEPMRIEKPIRCSLCKKEFFSMSARKEHFRDHLRRWWTTCPSCGKYFIMISEYLNHILLHIVYRKARKKQKQRSIDLVCDICQKRFFKKKTHKLHMTLHQTCVKNKPVLSTCKICTKQFNTERNLKRHVDRHKKGPFCKICLKIFKGEDSLEIHMSRHTGEKPFKCTVCSQRFGQKTYLISHMNSHTGERPFQCELCSIKFSSKRTLARHIRCKICVNEETKPVEENIFPKRCSPKSNENNSEQSPENPLACYVCSKTFKNRYSLNRHMKNHDKKEFRCDLCFKLFSRRDRLTRHIRGHEKTFSCEICPKKFGYKSTLKDHILVHYGEKPFKCDVCSKSFTQKSNLKTHGLVHLPGSTELERRKKHKCGVCSNSYASKRDLKMHIFSHC